MTKTEFINTLLEALEVAEPAGIDESTLLQDIEEYDSLGILTIIGLADKHFNVKIRAQHFTSFKTVGDLMEHIGLEKFEQEVADNANG